jgi:ABC-type multidrug transport system fused ATPase/permease subunit
LSKFKGNIDPSGCYSDLEILLALEKSCLREKFEEKGLDSEIKENGDNLSAGERQLICIAQAVLKENKIVLIDEATANLDISTDRKIQKVIRENFAKSTVLTIAHRIDTIMNSDRVIVLHAGQVAEVGEPYKLIKTKDSKFQALWKEARTGMSKNL